MVNGGSLAAARTYDAAAGGDRIRKTWLTGQGAKHPRHELYEGLNGQTRALVHPFLVNGSPMMHPGDPAGPPGEVICCRCAVAFVEAPTQQAGERAM